MQSSQRGITEELGVTITRPSLVTMEAVHLHGIANQLRIKVYSNPDSTNLCHNPIFYLLPAVPIFLPFHFASGLGAARLEAAPLYSLHLG
jgi:hypothetical protein